MVVAMPWGGPARANVPFAPAQSWRRVTFDGVSLRVPATWPVVDFRRHPRACPLLDVRAVYVGAPGRDPRCPARGLGRTEAVMIGPARPGDPDVVLARTAARRGAGRGGQPMLTNSDRAAAGAIVDVLPRSGTEVYISYGGDPALARAVQASVTPGQPSPASPHRTAGAAPRATGAAPRTATPPRGIRDVYAGGGFDTCTAPGTHAMTSWLASAYRAVGVYIGGINRACAQPNLTPAWLASIQAQGWRYFLIYPGLQSSCVLGTGDATITTSQAAPEGRAAANDAAARAAALGIPPGTPISFDMEAYAPACDSQVTTFLSAWDAQLHARGYTAAVYESFTNIGALVRAASWMTEPDVIYYADWDGQATTTSPYMPRDMWTGHRRLHQYLGGHLETHGGVTLDVDSDQLDVDLSGPPAPGPPPGGYAGFRISVAVNANGTAEWFARTADGRLAHAWQAPVGTLTWSRMRAVGDSPAGLAGNPAAAAQANGVLTVFARTTAGPIAHAWQQAGFPNDWEWGTALAPPRKPARTGTDPAAVLLPGGTVEVYLTTVTGAVETIRQRRPDDNAQWTAWGVIKGSCASSPVPVTDSARNTDVFCVTTAGTAAFDSWNGRSWSGWKIIANGPSDLTGVPAVTVDGAGQTELLAATRSGGLAYAWQRGPAGAAGGWTWGAPLAGPGAGAWASLRLANSPAAATWPAGQVIAYAAQRGGPPLYARQLGTSGPAPWGPWAPVAGAGGVGGVGGGTMMGSPAGWLNSTGAAGIAVLDGNLRLAVASDSGGGWSPWTEAGGGF